MPALPRNKSAFLLGKLAPQPVTRHAFSAKFSNLTPSVSKDSNMRAVSSDANKSRISVVPVASAASNKVRFEILLEPGKVMRPSARMAGRRVSCSILFLLINDSIG